MNKKQWQKSIKENEGYIFSDGTLNIEHLLVKAADFIASNDFHHTKELNYTTTPKNIYASILDCMQAEKDIMDKLRNRKASIAHHHYYSEIEMKPEANCDYSPYHVWDDFECFMQYLAPEGYFFGSHEGDSACIGFFKIQPWE